ncbi:hypothetical protein [Kitasatospora sp. NPDC059571]|uniref:hypothetical protein n=1 Tax=Kitasatospora sp. NPDC059571 TaxID=3346871 RepID=UPI0036B9E056
MFGVEVGPGAAPERALAAGLLPLLSDGMLPVADRDFLDLGGWYAARAAGAGVVWHIGDEVAPAATDPLEDGSVPLEDGSCLADLPAPDGSGSERVRAVGAHSLVTGITDARRATAGELAALYDRGRADPDVLRAIRTRCGGPTPVLRSRDSGGVEQEVLGLVLVPHALREFLPPGR